MTEFSEKNQHLSTLRWMLFVYILLQNFSSLCIAFHDGYHSSYRRQPNRVQQRFHQKQEYTPCRHRSRKMAMKNDGERQLDWREHRARLTAGSEEGWDRMLSRNQNRAMRSAKVWAHEIFHPEPGCLVLSKPYQEIETDNILWDQGVAVVLDCNGEKGASGFFLNQPSCLSVKDVTDEMPEFQHCPLYCGGDYGQGELYIMHGLPDIPRSRKIVDGLYIGGDLQLARDLVSSGQAMPNDFKFMLQKYVWGPSELEWSLQLGMCQLASTNVEVVLKSAVNLETPLWREVMSLLGGVHELKARDIYNEL